MRTSTESELLRQILAETKRIEEMPERRDYFEEAPMAWVQRSRAMDDLKAGFGVLVAAIGQDNASRKAKQRCLEAMERSGLITLHAPAGQRRTHAKLTAAGRKLAKAFAQQPAGRT